MLLLSHPPLPKASEYTLGMLVGHLSTTRTRAGGKEGVDELCLGIGVRDDDGRSIGGFWVSRRWCIGVERREGTAVHHSSGEVVHCGVGLQVEVPEHCPRVPSAEQTNAAAVDAGTEERHRACGAEAADGHPLWINAKLLGREGCFNAKSVGEVFRLKLNERPARAERE